LHTSTSDHIIILREAPTGRCSCARLTYLAEKGDGLNTTYNYAGMRRHCLFLHFLWSFEIGRSANCLLWVSRLRVWSKAQNPKGKRKNEEVAGGCGKMDHLPVERKT
jgi:hypothetical protein